MKRLYLLLAAAAAAATGVAVITAALVASPGCAGDCASDCPPTSVYIGNLDNTQLYIDNITGEGPACPPPSGLYCLGDSQTTNCTHFTVTGQAEGICDVTIWFHDRPITVVRTQFGGPVQKGCCKGRSIIGDNVFIIPPATDAGVIGWDGGTDAVRIVIDAGTTPETGGNGAAGADGGTDAADASTD